MPLFSVMNTKYTSEGLSFAGLIGLILGAADPASGILIAVPGSGLIALGAFLGGHARRNRLLTAFLLMLAGALAAWWITEKGGVGGQSDLSIWWLLLVVPLPVGWVMSLLGTLGTGIYRKLLYFAFLLMGFGLALMVLAFSTGLFDLDAAMSMGTVYLVLLLPYLAGLLICLSLSVLRFYRNIRRHPATGTR